MPQPSLEPYNHAPFFSFYLIFKRQRIPTTAARFRHYCVHWHLCIPLLRRLDVAGCLLFFNHHMTTIGYGDLSPQTDGGKLFTIFYILVGIGIILGFINAVYLHYKNLPKKSKNK